MAQRRDRRMHANTSERSQSGAQPSGGARGSEPMGAAAFSYAPLQNGSDVRGVAIAGVPGEEVNLDRAAAAAVVKVRRLVLLAVLAWLDLRARLRQPGKLLRPIFRGLFLKLCAMFVMWQKGAVSSPRRVREIFGRLPRRQSPWWYI